MFGVKFINPMTTPSIKMRRVNAQLELIADNYTSPEVANNYQRFAPQTQVLLTQALEGEGCQLNGFVEVFKVNSGDKCRHKEQYISSSIFGSGNWRIRG